MIIDQRIREIDEGFHVIGREPEGFMKSVDRSVKSGYFSYFGPGIRKISKTVRTIGKRVHEIG